VSRAAEELRERNHRFPSVTEAFFLVVALWVVQYVSAAALRDFTRFAGIDARDIHGAVKVIGNGILFSLLLYYKRLSYASLFHSSTTSVGATLAILALPILLTVPADVLAMSALSALLQWVFPLSSWEQAMFERMMSNQLAAFVTVCIVAPLVEEMLFRGILLRSFLLQYTRGRAFVYSAVLFGFAHLNIYQFAVGFFGGLCLAWLYERTRSLWPCVLSHAAYNGVVTWLWWSEPSHEEIVPDSWALWALSLPLAFLGVFILVRLLEPRRATSRAP
jgi:membrane protease YdiL (CAAX protease family)